MVPLTGPPFKFSVVSPWFQFPPKGKAFQYYKKSRKTGIKLNFNLIVQPM